MFKRSLAFLSLVGILLLVTACASTPSPPDNVRWVSDATLRTDVMGVIGVWEAAAGGSPSPKLVSTESLGKEGESYMERWVVDSNGKSVAYMVVLTPSPRGGVDYAISRL
jgi:hypothetical protein